MIQAPAQDAVAAFYTAHWRRLWAFLVRVGVDRATAQDVAQEAFARWAMSPATAWDERRARAYLFTTARRLLADHYRARRRDVELPADLSTGENEHDFPLAGAWRRLADRERALLWLAHAEEFSHEEIARIVGVGRASVRVLLHRAREKARNLLSGELE